MPINMLCVDDEPSWRHIFQMSFKDELTPNVDFAEGYSSAMKLIKSKNYDLIILDSLNGAWKQLYRVIEHIPHGDVIIFSGDEHVTKEAEAFGLTVYSKSEATASIDKIIEQYKSK